VDLADSEDRDDNGDGLGATEQLESKAASLTIDDVNDTGKATTSSSLESDPRFEALVRDRDSLRAEVVEMRRSLEEIQSKHDEEMNAMQKKLEDTTNDKEHAESQFRNLLGKVNTIKSQLGERLKADAVCLEYCLFRHINANISQ
jgi:predicted  nucleic acid-binding Zn-ribbon protein